VKKLVIGCALALVLFGIAGSVAFYYFVYKPARSFVASLSELGELAEMDAKVTNTQTFAAPSADTLTEAQVRRFVAVQESLHARMGTRASELQAKYQAIEARSPEGVGMAEAVGAYRDLFGIIAEAKKAQVEALNAQNFSVDEYTWVKSRFYEAAGVTVTGIDFREMAGKVKSGDLSAVQEMITNAGAAASGAVAGNSQPDEASKEPAPPATLETDTVGVGIPDANKTLVAPYKDKAATWLIYGAFGL
jgi:hypothetical protein